MNNYSDLLNRNVVITSASIFAGREPTLLSSESQAEKFGEWLRETRENAGLSKADLAREAKIARSYVTNLEGAVKNVLTEKPTLPKVDIVDRIADALGVDRAEARLAAGYASGNAPAELANIELQRLYRFYNDLPRECQLDVLASMEGLWKRRRAQGRAERSAEKSSGKHRPQTVKPGVERPHKRRKAS